MSATAALKTGDDRRYDLDWIRIAAFGVLILYHVGLCYGSGTWVANSRYESTVVDALLLASHPWRLMLLFLISGAATACMASRRPPGRLWLERSKRLLLPLIFGMIVIVPPQIYCIAQNFYGLQEDYWTFWMDRYFGESGAIVHDGRRFFLVYTMHLWFLLYVWVYTTVAIVLGTRTELLDGLRRAGERFLRGPRLLLWPILFLILTRQVIFPACGELRAITDDWYSHVDYFAAFAFGFVFARPGPVWQELCRMRGWSLGLAVAAWAAQNTLPPLGIPYVGATDGSCSVMNVLHSVERWSAVATVLGFGYGFLDRDAPVLRYLTGAVFTYYIVHQTFIVVGAHLLARQDLAVGWEAAALIGGTAAGCALSYELVRRVRILRPFFGMPVVAARVGLRPPARTLGPSPA